MEVVTLSKMIASVERELAFRARVYPRWVEQGKMTQGAADAEVARMTGVRDLLLRIRANRTTALAAGYLLEAQADGAG